MAELVDEATLEQIRSELAHLGTAAVLDRTLVKLKELVAHQS